MGDRKIAIDKTIDRNEIAAFLRLLADELEGKNSGVPNEFGSQLHEFNKLKISLVKQEGGQLALRLKIKDNPHSPENKTTEFTDIAEQEYKPFKQAYKATFAELNSLANQGSLPSAELLSRFMAESRRLVSFKGFGDEYYADFTQACLEMEQSVKDGGIATFQEKVAAIRSLKKACHLRYK